MKKRLLPQFLLILAMTAPLTAADNDSSTDGWISLFDGKTLDGWVQRGGDAKYRAEDGQIVGTSAPNTSNSFLCTEKDYADFVLELDFKVDEGLNSGIQVRSHAFDEPTQLEWHGRTIKIAAHRVHGYQVEIDPAQKKMYDGNPPNLRANGEEVPVGAEPRRWSGGIYDEARRGWLNNLTHNEAARKAFKPGEWNHFRIECRGDSLKTWLNGVPAADLKDDMTASGFIALQVHAVGSNETPMSVHWRNIRLKEL